MVALLVPALLCQAQDSKQADQATSPPVAAPSANSQSQATYVIGASDVRHDWIRPGMEGTELFRHPSRQGLTGMVSVPQQGVLGDIQASGLTPLQLADQLATRLKKYIQDPNVSVVISQIHSKVIYMLGEIGKKGPIEMTPGMTLLEAISSAGGLTDFANSKKIYILRDEAGKRQNIPVHYKQALKGDSALNLALKPGDTNVDPKGDQHEDEPKTRDNPSFRMVRCSRAGRS